jgi:hypothetical protein
MRVCRRNHCRGPWLVAAIASLAVACSASGKPTNVVGHDDATSPEGGDDGSSAPAQGASSGDGGAAGIDSSSRSPDAGTTTDATGGASTDSALAGPDGSNPADGGSATGRDAGTTGVPSFDHVLLLLMENESQSDIRGNSAAPYINGTLLANYAYTTNYSTTYHPSLPNYFDLTTGSSQSVTCDCQPTGSTCDPTCALFTGACGCHQAATHIGDQFEAAQIEWRQYAESMGSPCNSAASAPFAAKHVPFLYYDNVYTNMTRCQRRVRDYTTDFAVDLAAGTYRYSFISPNLCSDMHGDSSCPNTDNITQGDTWLSQEVPKILATPGFGAGGRDVLFIVWDEQTNSTGGSTIPMLCIIISPLAKPGPTAKAYTHESLLATIEDAFGFARLGNAGQASPISDVWR